MSNLWHVIGISGVTCGGKSSVTKKLKETLSIPVVVINQDDYFLDPDDKNHNIIEELNHANWEILTSLDMEKLLNDVTSILSHLPDHKQLLIIEGILVMNFKPLADLMDQKFYLTLTKEECESRRRVRSYNPPDPPLYFEKCVWPMYEKHYQEVMNSQHDIVILNGAEPQDKLFRQIYKTILEKL